MAAVLVVDRMPSLLSRVKMSKIYAFQRCRMTITVSNRLGGEKRGSTFVTQQFTGEYATKKAAFQFDFERPTHCLLEAGNGVANVVNGKTNCTVFPISINQSISTVCSHFQFYAWGDRDIIVTAAMLEVYCVSAVKRCELGVCLQTIQCVFMC